MRTGIVLAGGAGTRFGSAPKGLTPFQGTALVTRVAHALQPTVDELLLLLAPGADERPWRAALATVPGPVRVAMDPAPQEGPAAALRAALPLAGPLVALAPCDAPLVTAAVYERLWARLAEGVDAAVPRSDGRAHPLVAAYRGPALARALDGAHQEGDVSMRGALARLRVAWVEDADLPPALANVNTREDLTRLERDR